MKAIACKENFVLKAEFKNHKTLKINKIQNEIVTFKISAAGNNLYIFMGSIQNGFTSFFAFGGAKSMILQILF